MATSLTTTLTFVLKTFYTNALDLSIPNDPMNLDLKDSFANGVIIDTADMVWHDRRSAAAANDPIDFSAALTGPLGTVLTFAKIKSIAIHNRSVTIGDFLTIGGGANEFPLFVAAGDQYAIGPNNIFFIWDPSLAARAVGAGTDTLNVNPGANTIEYDIVVIGTTA